MLLRDSAAHSEQLAAELVSESRAGVSLLRGMQAARLAGSGYMEGGELDDLAAFRAAERQVEAGLQASAFDEQAERTLLAGIGREWRAAVRQLRATPSGSSEGADGLGDAEDVFEERVNAAIEATEDLVEVSQREADDDLSATRRVARWQELIAIAALLVSLVLAAFLARRMAAALVRPLRELTLAARALGDGTLEHRVPAANSAELLEMGDTFNRMASELRDQHDQLEHQAFTDALTGIPNRAFFEHHARRTLEQSASGGDRVAVLMIDLDDFKLVNDGLGHAAGDELVTLAAARISGAARPSDTVARLGGDEFAVLLERVGSLDDVLAVAERLHRLFDAPFHLQGAEVIVSASIGIALAHDAPDADDLLRRADLAMYRVKADGKKGTAFFDPAMEDQAVTRLDAVSALRSAVDRDELVAHYQPIVDLDSGEVVAAEALLRWERPGHGLISPAQFIPLAEETGLIQRFGAWILREACLQARDWRANGHPLIRVNVNVSARQLIDPRFEQIVQETLDETGLTPDALTLEVTESSVMRNPELTIAKLERIVRTGVRLSLDDFGEGYSSLSHIRRLPIHGLKIARPFVKELGDPAGDPRLVRGIMELARRLELDLVAEGIELPAQRDALRSFGCSLGQGFLFARPLPLPAFRALLRETAKTPSA
jgi:diguanylate cyclase (GGDEF)-like protein